MGDASHTASGTCPWHLDGVVLKRADSSCSVHNRGSPQGLDQSRISETVTAGQDMWLQLAAVMATLLGAIVCVAFHQRLRLRQIPLARHSVYNSSAAARTSSAHRMPPILEPGCRSKVQAGHVASAVY